MNLHSIAARSRPAATLIALVALAVLIPVAPLAACPFCTAVARTFTEQMNSFDIVVIARLDTPPEAEDETRLPRARFTIIDFLKGRDMFEGEIPLDKSFEAIVVSRKHAVGDHFLVMGNGTRKINWSTPMKVSDRVVDYLKKLDSLPESGPERLVFFADHFEDEEVVLANDAYDEFANASYQDIKDMADQLDPDKLLVWLQDPDVMKSRKRQYYTLLGVCGGAEHLPFLEEVIRSDDRDRQSGLDALIACYLTLYGDQGVPLVVETFLANPQAEYIDVFSAIAALRFHGTEADKVSRERIVEALRHVLDRPRMADMVIPDLARWEDWSVMDRLVTMYREANTDDTKWVRTPIISYLQACPDPDAAGYIDELREIDPEAVERAEMLAELDWEDDDGWGEDEESGDQSGDQSGDDSENTAAEGTQPAAGDGEPASGTGGTDSGTGAVEQPGLPSESSPRVTALKPVAGTGENRLDPAHPASRQQKTPGLPAVAANRQATSYVSTSGASGDAVTTPVGADPAGPATPPVATVVPGSPPSSLMILSVFLICVLLFALLWSVLNGWFERLIF